MNQEQSNEWIEKLKQTYAHLIDDSSMFAEEKKEELLDQLAKKTGKTKEELTEMLKKM